MVDVLGHLGMALIWLAPAWFLADREETALTLVLAGFWFGMLPDVDLLLSKWFPQSIHHHGVVHTVLVVTLLAVVLGPALGWVLKRALGGSKWFSEAATRNAAEYGFLTVWVASLSHLFADMLSAPDVASPIEPFWPLYNGQIVLVDVFYFTSLLATWGLLALGIAVNAAFWAATRSGGE